MRGTLSDPVTEANKKWHTYQKAKVLLSSNHRMVHDGACPYSYAYARFE